MGDGNRVDSEQALYPASERNCTNIAFAPEPERTKLGGRPAMTANGTNEVPMRPFFNQKGLQPR
jgi:hypothetical protein